MKKTTFPVLALLLIVSVFPLRAQPKLEKTGFLERLRLDFEYQFFVNKYGQYPGFRVSGPGRLFGKQISWGGTFNAGEWHKNDQDYVTIRSVGIFGQFQMMEDWLSLNVSPRIAFLLMKPLMSPRRVDTTEFKVSPGLEVALASKISEDFSVTAGGSTQFVESSNLWKKWPLSFFIRFSFDSPWKAFRRADTVGESRGYKKAKNEYEQTLQIVSKEKENLMDSLKFVALEMKKLTADRSTFPENEREIETKQDAQFLQVFNTKDTSADSPIILDKNSLDANGRLRRDRLNDLAAILVSNTEYFWKLEYGQSYSEKQMMSLIEDIVGQIPELRNKILLSVRASKESGVRFVCLGRFNFQ